MAELLQPEWKTDAYIQNQWREFYALRRKLLPTIAIGAALSLAALYLLLWSPVAWRENYWMKNRVMPFIAHTRSWYPVPAVVAIWMIQTFDCPRCNELFFGRFLLGNPFTRQCRHCSLHRPLPGELT